MELPPAPMLRTAGASLKPNALAVGGISRTFFSDDVAMLGALVAIAILFRDAIFWAVMSMEGYPRGFAVAHLHAALWQAG